MKWFVLAMFVLALVSASLLGLAHGAQESASWIPRKWQNQAGTIRCRYFRLRDVTVASVTCIRKRDGQMVMVARNGSWSKATKLGKSPPSWNARAFSAPRNYVPNGRYVREGIAGGLECYSARLGVSCGRRDVTGRRYYASSSSGTSAHPLSLRPRAPRGRNRAPKRITDYRAPKRITDRRASVREPSLTASAPPSKNTTNAYAPRTQNPFKRASAAECHPDASLPFLGPALRPPSVACGSG